MNRILFLSVNRSDYGIWRSILRALKSDPNNVIGLFATGGHLSTVHGQTISEILQDQFYDQLFQSSCTLADSSPSGSAASISLVSCNFAQVIDNFKPDFIFVLGDRYEVLAATLVASLYRIPIVHFHGGSVTEGALDDNYRHAISKLSNYHFVECVDFKIVYYNLAKFIHLFVFLSSVTRRTQNFPQILSFVRNVFQVTSLLYSLPSFRNNKRHLS